MNDLRGLWAEICKRPAVALCAGVAIVAFDRFVLTRGGNREWLLDYTWRDIHDGGWIAFVGTAVALFGFYHWIAQSRDPRI